MQIQRSSTLTSERRRFRIAGVTAFQTVGLALSETLIPTRPSMPRFLRRLVPEVSVKRQEQ